GRMERLVISKLMKRAPCIDGRATTCWQAFHEDDPRTPLVIKDSWQYVEREEEGELLYEATTKGVINLARYYAHATVYVRSRIDEVRGNVRGDLDMSTAINYRPERLALSSSTRTIAPL